MADIGAMNAASDVVKRLVKSAKASKGMGWDELSEAMRKMGLDISANHLAVKVSRGTLRATELICLMRATGHAFIDLSALPPPERR